MFGLYLYAYIKGENIYSNSSKLCEEGLHMDGKMVVASVIFAGLVLSSGLAVYFASQLPDEVDDGGDGNGDSLGDAGQVVANEAPQVFSSDAVFEFGERVVLTGFVADENVSSVSVQIQKFTQDSLATPFSTSNISVGEDGLFSENFTEFTVPGEILVEIVATDDEGVSSETKMVRLVLLEPDEEPVRMTMHYISAEEGSSLGLLRGELIHLFPETCSVEFWPSGQSTIEGVVNSSSSTYVMAVDEETVERDGEVWATCGLYSVETVNFTYRLPIPEEPPVEEVTDSDGDGIVDADDECEDSPAEPVWPNGCAQSELDSDGDGVTDDIDLCPDTGADMAVDADGCAENQKDADGDGISDAGDQCPDTPPTEVADANGCSDSQKDQDGDGVPDSTDQCPNTMPGTTVGPDGCEVIEYSKDESWLCQGAGVGPVEDLNPYYGYQSNSNSPFTCRISVTMSSTTMTVNSNGIPSHDFASTRGCCIDEVDYTWSFPLNPVNDSDGTYEMAPDRGAVAVSVDGVPLFGPEDGPGSDAVALEHEYFVEDRQQIDLGICGAHGAGVTAHYHFDANCVHWTPAAGEDMTDYHWSKIDSTQHSGIIGWAFDGYPIYGMYGWDDQQNVVMVGSSYQLKATGDDGYNGMDDWEYIPGLGDLDECNGRWGPTPEFPEGTYHYVSTPRSGSTQTHTDINGQTVDMIGFPYFLLCYHGEATGSGKGNDGGGGAPPGAGGRAYEFNSQSISHEPAHSDRVFEVQDNYPIWLDLTVTFSLFAIIFAGWGSVQRRN